MNNTNCVFKALGRPLWRAVLSLVVVVVVVGLIYFRHVYSQYSPQRGWIDMYTSTKTQNYYIVTSEKCTPEDLIGLLANPPRPNWNSDPQDLGPGGTYPPPFSNVLPKGTMMYQIKRIDSTKAFCVALNYGNGGYVKAVYVGHEAPH